MYDHDLYYELDTLVRFHLYMIQMLNVHYHNY